MKRTLTWLLFAISFSLAAREDETITVDAISLGAIGTGISEDGWCVTNVSNYSSDYSRALRINTKDSIVVSPVFSNSIVSIELEVVSSSAQYRRLAITPIGKTGEKEALRVLCDYSESKDKFSAQTFNWPAEERIKALKFSLVGSNSTSWGIRKMVIGLAANKGFALHIR